MAWNDGFWDSEKKSIEAKAVALRKQTSGKTGYLFIFWQIVLRPIFIFFISYFLKGNILRMRNGFTLAVHEAVLEFAISARAWEMANSEQKELNKIKQEWAEARKEQR